MDLARQKGLQLPAFHLADEIFRATMSQYGDVGCLAVIKTLEAESGVYLGSESDSGHENPGVGT